MIEIIEAGAVLAPLLSAIGVVVLYHYIGRDYLGADENAHWNNIRRTVLLSVDEYVKEYTGFTTTNSAKPSEYFGSLDASSHEVAQVFEAAGYVQGVLAGLKGRNVSGEMEYEAGSMVFRESKSDLVPDVLAMYQTHVYWFENSDGGVDLYAHYEYSSANPLVAWKHYQAVGLDAERGITKTRAALLGEGVAI